ncbi:MAG: glycine zipper 2TM domain-containing protein [Mizugakiibacter sp.]|uniref:glycine zipper 2TM domain-containing protein n=1 Tax=Mizugakiibacter sp. TaxID=1972610 RepID=UPI0031C4BEFE|nr:glycine zipper 2TM domain-containing protein [Xanthomonadaceae bacterium]
MNMKSVLAIALVAALGAGAAAPTSAAEDVITKSDGSMYVRCYDCGVVQQVTYTQSQTADHGTAGAVIGAVAGGLLGHQVGGGKGKTAATVAGVAGGAYAGKKIGEGKTKGAYQVSVRMWDGKMVDVNVEDAGNLRKGDIVRVDDKGNITLVQQR